MLCEDISYYPNHRLRISRSSTASSSSVDPASPQPSSQTTSIQRTRSTSSPMLRASSPSSPFATSPMKDNNSGASNIALSSIPEFSLPPRRAVSTDGSVAMDLTEDGPQSSN